MIGRKKPPAVLVTVADLSVVHPGVRVGAVERRGVSRLLKGQNAATDAEGRARVRLDDGSVALVDHSSEIGIDDGKIALTRGRLFVLGAPGAKTEVKLGEVM